MHGEIPGKTVGNGSKPFRKQDGDILTLPQRKLQRLKQYDYNQNAAYFITICTHNKDHILGEIIDGQMILNAYGKIIHETYRDLPNHNHNMESDKYIIMPNHIHCIIIINNCRERFATVPNTNENKKINGVPEIIRQLKTFSSKRINEYRKRNGLEPFPTNTIWQKSYHDHIIRKEAEYQEIWEYIDTNPLKWELDKYYT